MNEVKINRPRKRRGRRGHPAFRKMANTNENAQLLYRHETRKQAERDRNYYNQGKGSRLLSLDLLPGVEGGEDDGVEPAWLSDEGRFVDDLVDLLDHPPLSADERRDIVHATAAYVATVMPHALPTLLLIIKNSGNRKDAICELRKYRTLNTSERLNYIGETLNCCCGISPNKTRGLR